MALKQKKPAKLTINRSLLAFINPQSAIAEEYRTIRNNIRYASREKSVQSLAVTSPIGGEGKSTAAVNLAISMAQRGDKVLLIDTNVFRPQLHHIFGVEASLGLTDVLMGNAELTEAVKQTEAERLFVLPAGSAKQFGTELLGSRAMTAFMEQAKSMYDVVVLDCPSVLANSDAGVLAGICDGAILILSNGKTKLETAQEAKRALEFGNVNLLGTVLNKNKG